MRDFLRQMLKSVDQVIFGKIFGVIMALSLVFIGLDMVINAWLFDTAGSWRWYNYFFSRHAFTMVFINYGVGGFVPLSLYCLSLSIFVYVNLDKVRESPLVLRQAWDDRGNVVALLRDEFASFRKNIGKQKKEGGAI